MFLTEFTSPYSSQNPHSRGTEILRVKYLLILLFHNMSRPKFIEATSCFYTSHSSVGGNSVDTHTETFDQLLNKCLLRRWRWCINRVIRNYCRGFSNLPTLSPDATPCDFFLWGYVKCQDYVPPLPAITPELKVRIRTAIETTTADMLQTLWNELDYRVDVCRIKKRAHIEHP